MREPSTEHARGLLTALGFRVEDIEQAQPEKRADLRAFRDLEEYVVEAKHRDVHGQWHKLRRQARLAGGATVVRSVEPWNALSSMVEGANEQLTSTPAQPEAFRILWAVALHEDGEFVVECLEKRLLGVRTVTAFRDANSEPAMLECYHHAHNSFQQLPSLDAAVLCTRTSARLCVNYYSPSMARLRAGHLYREFAERKSVIDPEIEVMSNGALMLARDFVGPRDGHTQWAYLKDRYSMLTSVGIESQFNGLMIIKSDELVPPEDTYD